jgi:hypothetical protein
MSETIWVTLLTLACDRSWTSPECSKDPDQPSRQVSTTHDPLFSTTPLTSEQTFPPIARIECCEPAQLPAFAVRHSCLRSVDAGMGASSVDATALKIQIHKECRFDSDLNPLWRKGAIPLRGEA